MPNLGSVLKQEMARIARRELRTQIAAAKKSSAQQKRHLLEVKTRVAVLERKLAAIGKLEKISTPAPPAAESPEMRVRFAPKGLRSLRGRLGLSAERFGRLIGVTGQSIYNWEQRVTTPRAQQLQQLAAVRSIGKREALARLEKLDAQSAPTQTARPTSDRRSRKG